MALSSDNGIEEGLQKITTKISDLDYKIDTIMNTGDKNAASASENSLTTILKSFQDIKKEHAQLSAEMEKFKVRIDNHLIIIFF